MRPEQISQPTQNTTVPAPQVIAPYASELDGGASYTTAGPQIENEPYRPQKQGRRQLLTTAYRSHLWGLIWTVIILILLALLAGIGMKLVGKYRKAPSITNSDSLTSVSAPTGLLGNQLLTVNGQLKVTGLTTLQSGLKVTGPTNLQDDVSVGGNLNVAKNAAVTGTLTAGGLRVLGGVSAPTFQGGNFTGGAVNVTTISAAGVISGGSFTGNGTGLTGVNATLLNGQQGNYYLNASNISGGVLGIQYGGTGATTSAGARANLGAAAAGANNDITSLSGLTTALSASQGGTGVDGSTAGPGQILIGNGSGYSLSNLTQGSGISITNASGSITIGVDSTVCTTAGNCGTGSGGGITGSGSADTIAMFTGAGSTLGNSLLSQSGSTVSVLGNLSASGSFTATSGTFSGAVSAGSVSTTGGVTAASANVSGNVTAGSFTGNGAGVTNVNAALLNGQAGSYYTNASNLSTGTVADARLSTNVTLQGNTFNGPNQLVQLTATGALPALDGSNVSNVNAASLQGYAASYFTDASNLSSGTLADARLSSNVPLKNTNNTFTGSNTFAGVAATSVSAVSILQNGNTVCDMSGNCAGVGGGVTTSGGTAGVLPVFTGAGSIANSLVSQAGSTVTVAGTLVATALQGSGAGLTSLNGSNIASGTVAVSYGGTGATSFTTNGIIYGNGTGSLQATAAGTSGQCLVATTGSAPSWQSCSAAAGTPSTLAGDVTGPLSSNTVSNLQGSTLTLTTPAAGNFLLFDGAAWVNQSISGDATVSSGGALTVANSAITSAKILDATITAADIAAGTITGSNIASGSVTGSNIAGSTITGSNIAAGTVANGNLVNSSLTVTAGTGLTGGGSVALGGSTTLQVSYGNTAGTAVAGNTTLICPSGTGNLTGGGNTITLGSGGTCNNLSVVASPSFTGLTISSFGAGIVTADASGNLSSGNLDRNSSLLTGQTNVANGGTGATTAAGARTNLGAAASGANSDITSLSAVTSIGSTGSALTLQGNASTILSATDSGFTTSVGFAAPTANVNYIFPVAAAGTYDICTTAGNCAGAGGGISGSGSVNSIAMFTGSGTIGNSILSQSGTTVTVAGTLSATTLQGSGANITNLNGTNITSGTVGVSVGGTGATTFTQYGVVYGNGTGALQATVAGTTGQCLVATTSAAPSWVDCVTAASGATPGGSAGGDLSGTYPNPYVTGLAGTALSVSSLTGGDILIYNGTNWVNAALSGDITVDSAGISTIAAGTVTGAKIAAGTITGSNIASGTIANSNLVNSGLTITAGTGLTGGGAVSLGGSTTLNVNFGSTAGTAVAGNTTLTCPTGTGNLTGGGTVITLGAGGTCGSLSTVASPTFTGLTLSGLSTGAVLSDASGNLTYGTIDLGSSSYVSGTLGLSNGGTGATTAAGARTNLGAAASGANSDITSLSGLTTMLSAGQGGTGVDGATAANGQLLIGNGSGYTLANLTQGSNIAITNAAGSITIGLTGTVPVTNGGTGAGAFTANGLVYGNGTGALQATAAGTTGQCLIANTGAAPTWGSCSGSAGVTTSSSGTANTIAMFTGTSTIANSIMTQSGSTISVAGTLAATTLQGDGALVTNVDAVSLGGQAPSYYTNASNLSAGVVPTGRISGTYSGLTGTGALTSGSIGTGFGAISTGSAISTTAALQGNTLSIGSGTFMVDATGAITAATGITSSGTVTLSSLGTGVVKATGGVLSTGTVTLGTDTSGAYVAALGTLTGLTTTGNSGAGSTPSLSVTYGAAADTAAQGNTALSFTGSGNLTGTVSGTAGGGFSTNTLAIVNNPTFSGLLTANGGVAATTGTFSGAVTLSSLGAGIVQTNASGVVSSATIDRNSALLTGQTSVANGGTGASTASGARTNLGAAASGANTDITSLANATSVGSTGAALTLQGNASTVLSATDSGFTTSVGFAVPTANVSYLFDTAAAGTYNICTTAGNCAGTGGGVTTSGGTNGTIAMFTGSQTIANSILSQSGSTVTVAGTLAATTLQGSGSGITNLNGTNITSGTVGVSVGGTGTTTFTQYGVVYGNGTGALQATVAGTTGQCLVGNTSGAPSWVSCASAGGGSTPGGSAGGDLSGTYPNPTVSGLSGTALSISSLTSGDMLIYNGTNWVNASLSGDLTVTGAGVATIANGAVTGAKIAAATITGSNIASSTVTNANLVNSSLTVNAGTGLTGGGSVALGGSITLNVAYGSTATTAVAGNTTLTCPTGTGNLTGGGNTITLGSGGTCGSLSTVASPTFSGLTLSGLTTAGIVVNDASGNLSTVTSLPVANGGTNTSSIGSAGSLAYSNGSAYAFSGVGTSGQCLVSGGSGAPTWTSCSGAAGVGSYINNQTTNQTGANFNIQSGAVGNVTGVIRAFAAQTADLLQFQNSSATAVSGVDASGNFYIANSGFKQTLQSATLTANQTITMPNASGTMITTGNLTGITATGTITAGTWNGSTVGTAYGGTGATTFTSNGVLYGNGSGAILATAAGTTGQCLVATTGSAPTWQSCASASGTLAGDVTGSLGANTLSKIQNTTLTISSLTSGNFLQYNGTDWVNQSISGDATVSGSGVLTVANGAITGAKIASGTITNSNLSSGSYGNITGVGTLGTLTVSGAASTGALTASSIRDTGLTAGAVLSDASGNLSSGTINLASSTYVSGTLAVANGGTGSTTAAGARTNLGAAASGANSDITSLSGLTTALSVGQGGTNATSVGTAGSVAYSTGTAYAFSAAGTSGQCLTSGGSGAPTWTTCTGAGSGNTLQTAYTNSLGGTTPEIVLDNTRTTVDIQAYSGQTADLLNLRAYSAAGLGSVLFGVSNTGAVSMAGQLTVSSGGAAITGNTTISGTLTGLTGVTSSGTIQFSGLATGVVLSSSGTLSSGTINLASSTYVSGTLPVANGGTGLTSAGTAGTLLYSNGTSFLNSAAGTSGQCLTSGGSGAPIWANCATAAGVGSYINNGTTNQAAANFNITSAATSSVTAAIRAIASQSADLMQFQNSAGTAVSGVDNSGNWYYANSGFKTTLATAALTGNQAITLPNATGTVITTGNLNGITATGTITSGTWNGSTVGVPYGGTGASTLTLNGVLYGNGTGAIGATGAGTTGQCLVATTGAAPSWGSCSGSSSVSTSTAGTANTIAMFTGSSTIANSLLTQDAGATTVTVGGNLTVASGNTLTLAGLGSGILTSTSGTVGVTSSVPVANGGTGATTAAGARTNLQAAASGANSDITSLSGLTTALSVGQGGTGVTAVGAAGSIAYSNGTTYAFSAAGTSGQCLVSAGSGSPTWAACAAATGGTGYIQNTTTTQTSANFNIQSTATTSVTGAFRAIASQTADLIQFQTSAGVATGGHNSAGNLYYTNSGFSNVLQSAALTANRTITMPNASGTLAVSASGNIALDAAGNITFTGQLPVANGGTGSSTAAGARTNLGAAASGANSDITSLSGLSTALSVGQGGTGATTFTANGVVYGNGTSALASTAAGTTGQCLIATTGSAPTWGNCTAGAGGTTMGGDVTGTVAANTISKLQNTTVTISSLTSGNFLQYNGTAWVNQSLSGDLTVTGAGVATIANGVVTGAKIANNTITNTNLASGSFTNITGVGTLGSLTVSGAATLSGLSTAGIVTNTAGGVLGTVSSVPVANGGTGTTSAGSAGSLVYSNGSAHAFSAVGTSGQCLVSGGTGAPTWTSCSSAAGVGSYINNATTLQTSANFNIQSTATTSITGVIRQLASQTADLLQFQSSTGVATSGVNSAGNYYLANSGFTDVLQSATLTANRTVTLPDASGTLITTGNLTNITATGTITSGTWNGTAVGATYGGTGLTTYTTGDLLYANSSTTLARLADVASGQCLVSGGVGVAPAWGNCTAGAGGTTMGGDVTGTVAANTLSNIQGTQLTVASLTSGNMLMYNGTRWVNQSLSGDVTATGAGVATIANGAVTSAKIANNTITNTNLASGSFGNITGVGTLGTLTVSGAASTGALTASSITNSALSTAGIVTNTAGGVLGTVSSVPVANGGTNATTIGTAGSVAYSTGTAYAFSAAGTSGQCLTSGGTGAPTWTTCTGAGSGNSLQTAYGNSVGGTTPEITLDGTRTTLDIQAYSGQTADLLNLRAYSAVGLGSVLFGVSNTGAVTLAGGLTVQSGGAAITGNSTISGTLTGLTGLASSGTVQFSALGTGVVLSNGSGQLSNGTVNLASGSYVSGTLGVANGGTGLTSAGTAGTLVYSNGSAFANTAQGTSGQCLISNGSGAPTWTSCASAAGVGSYINNQTTNQTGANFNVTSGATTSVTGTIRALASQTADLLQFQNSAGAALSGVNTAGNWYYANSGFTSTMQTATLTGNQTITLPNATGTVITTGNLSSITATGTITSGAWNGTTVGIAYGGTGNTAYTTNGVNFYDGTKIASTAAGTTGQCLVGTTGSAPTWQSCSTAAGTPTTLAGDVTGALGSNTVSKLQGNVLTTTATMAAGQTGRVLQWNGSAWVDALVTNSNLSSGSYGNITGVGTLGTLTVSGAASTGALTASSIRDTGLTTAGVVTTDASGNLSSTATVPVANGGTGATTAAGARTNLQAAASGANSDITSLSGLTIALSVGQGGTGVTAVGSAGTIAYSNGTSYAFSAAGTAGQCLASGGSGAPTWTTCAAATGATGYIQNATATQSSANFNIQSAATTSITGVFRAIASQTADLVQFQTSAGAATGGHNSAGNLYYTNAGFTNTLQSAALTANRTITMPNASGTIAVSASGNIALDAAGNITFTGQLPVANGGTGSGTAAGARTNLGAAASGANSDITSLSGLSTALSVGQGGTGATTFTANGVVYGNGASALASTAAGTTGQCLVATTGSAPTWQSCSTAAGTPTTLGGDVTGSLSANTLSKIQNTTLTISSLTSGNFLMYNGTNWVNQSVSGDATVSGTGALTVANGAITGAKIANNTITNGNLAAGSFTNITGVGTLTAGTWNAGVIGAQYGGTGISSYTIGDLLYASGATSIGKLAAVAAGQCLLSNGVGAAPAWGTCPMTGANTTLSNLAATNINQALNTTSGNLNLTTTTSGNIVLNSAGTIELQDNTNVTGTLNATTGIQLNGTDINTAGTLTNVAYLNQANTFTAAQTVQLNSTSALLLNNSLGNSILRVDTTNKVLQLGAANLATTVIRFNTSVNAFNSTLGLVAPTVGNQTFNLPDMAAAGTYTLLTSQTAATSFIQNQHTAAQSTSQFWLSGDGRTDTSFTTPLLQSAAGAALSVDSGTTGALNIGTGANAKTITVGNTTSGTSTKLQAGVTSITTTNSGVIVSATAAQSSAFQIQNASSAAIFNVDTTNSAIDITGSLALKRGSDFTTTGTSNDVNFGNVSLVRLNGSSAQTITGIANGRDGYMLTIVNAANQTATIANSSTSSVAANRIITGTGANVGLVPGASAQLVYDSGSNMWRIVGAVTSNGVPAVRAYSTTSTILTAASGTYYAVPFNTELIDTDVMHDNVTDNTRFYAKTAGVYKISATIRYASNGMGGSTGVYTRLIIDDVGVLALTGDGASSASFRTSTATVMKYLNVGDYIVVHAYQDTGANMNVLGGTEDATSFDMYRIDGGLDNSSTMGGVTTVGTLDGGTRNATGASIASNNFYLQSAGTDYAGLVNTTAQTFGGVKTFNNGLVSTSLTAPTVQSAAGTALLVDSGTTGALNIGTSANAKTITIGNNTGATALNLVAGTGNVNITGTLVTGSQAADPTGNAGAMYYNSTTGSFRCYQAGTWQNCMGALYTTAADSTALNGGTTGAQFFSTAYSMPANYCTQGRAIHLSVGGVTTSTTTAQAMRFAVYVGGTQIGQAAATYTPTASQTNAAWFMDYTFTCRAAPSAASAIYGQGTVATQLTPTTAAVTNHIVPSNFAGVNVATNAAANIQIAVTYTGTANAANTVTLKQLVINSY